MPNPISTDLVPSPEALVSSLIRVFHKVSSVIAEEQQLFVLPPTATVADALREMRSRGFSQVPIVAGSEVLGAFSHRSFSERVLQIQSRERLALDAMHVDDFLEQLDFTHVTTDLRYVLTQLETHGAILVGNPSRITGILTTVDVLRYLFDLAAPFLFIEEIERCVRSLMERALRNVDGAQVIRQGVEHNYKDRMDAIPATLDDMSFMEYVDVICHGGNWGLFANLFGGTRERARANLAPVGPIRNQVFHFRGKCSPDDRQILLVCREWLLRRARIVAGEETRHAG